jgi:hypothetical protein
VLGEDRDDHGGIFRALALVDGGGIGGNQGVKFAESVSHRGPVEAGLEFAHLGIDVVDIADVAVIDFLVGLCQSNGGASLGMARHAETVDLAASRPGGSATRQTRGLVFVCKFGE